MRKSPLGSALLLVIFAAASPARAATITSLRYSYPGDCGAVKTRSARPQDTVTLVVGEPLEIEVAGAGLAPLAAGVGTPTRVEAPPGITATVKSSNAQGMTLSVLARTAGPARGAVPLRVVPPSNLPFEISVRAVDRPRIRSIRLGIPGTESLASVKVAPEATYPVSVAGTGLADLTFVHLPSSRSLGIIGNGGAMTFAPGFVTGGFNALFAPANFVWALDSCPVGGPNDAGLAIEVVGKAGISGTVATLAPPRSVSCGSEVRTALDDSWCASLPPPAPRSDATVAGPPIRWTVRADEGVVVGALEARLKDFHSRTYDTRSVPYLRPGESLTFETARPGPSRHVMKDAACAGCFDLSGPAAAGGEPVYKVEAGHQASILR